MMTEDKKSRVLLIDDEIQMRRLLRVCLENNGHAVEEAASGDEGIREAIRCAPDAILLDLGLPDMDGLEVLKRLREWCQAPILVVSVKAHEDEKITALDNGANDYITKPFGTGELLARLRAAQRLAQSGTKAEPFKSGRLEVDLAIRSVKLEGKALRLTVTEYAILKLFVKNAGKVITHGHIMREVWGAETPEKLGQLRVYMTYLREKIEKNPAEPELLITEPGVGYRMDILVAA